jgi:hypothetical protein
MPARVIRGVSIADAAGLLATLAAYGLNGMSTSAPGSPVQCPSEFDALLMEAGAVCEPGERRWLLLLHRLGPVLRALRRRTDPLFQQAGVDLDDAQ